MGFYPYPIILESSTVYIVCTKAALSSPSFKDRKYLSGRVLNQQPSTRRACASIELSVWRLDQHVKESGLQDNLQPSECSFDENETKMHYLVANKTLCDN